MRLLRIVIAGSIGLFVVVGHSCGGIDYHDSRNSGVGTAYVVYIGLGLMMLFAGSATAIIFFVTKWRFLPFLKWSSIILAVLIAIGVIVGWIASFDKQTQ